MALFLSHANVALNLIRTDHEQSSHDQRLLRHSLSSPIPQGQPVQDRRAHRDRCAHSRRGSKNLVWFRTTSSNDFTQSLSASRSDSPSDRRNASRAVGNRRNFRRGIKNALRSSRNVWVSRYGWIGRLGLFGDLRCPETTTHLNRGTGGSVERISLGPRGQRGFLEEGIKRDALLTSVMRPCRLRLAPALTPALTLTFEVGPTTFPMTCRELGQTRESQCCTESRVKNLEWSILTHSALQALDELKNSS